jgi:hypothetical protein
MFIIPPAKQKRQETQKKEEKYINTIKPSDFFSLNEIQISQRIREIPDYSRYFNPVIRSSFVNLAEIDDEKFDRCENIDSKNTHILSTRINMENTKTFRNVFYSTQNKSINQNSTNKTNEIIIKIQDPSKMHNMSKVNKKNAKNTILTLINSYKHLLVSLKLLENAKIVNLNLHPSTLNFSENYPVITGFDDCFHSQTMNNERISNLFAKYQPQNVFLPPEAHVLSFLIENNQESLSFSNIEDICSDCQKRLGSLSCFSKAFVEQYRDATFFSLQSLTNKPKTVIIQDILEKCTTWNGYSLSILFLVLLRDIFKKRGFPKNQFVSGFSQQLTQNIHPEPSKRPSILQNISLFNDILYNTSINDYEKLFSLLE